MVVRPERRKPSFVRQLMSLIKKYSRAEFVEYEMVEANLQYN